MTEQNTERACDRCRERRVKCDKTQPTCSRCEKLGKPCPGYDKKKRKFVDEGVSLRKKYLTSADDRRESKVQASGVVTGQSGLTETAPNHGDVALSDILGGGGRTASHGTTGFGSLVSILNAEPLAASPAADLPLMSVPPSLNAPTNPILLAEADSAFRPLHRQAAAEDMWDAATFDPAWFNLQPDEYYQNSNNSCGFIPHAHIVDEVDRMDPRLTLDIDMSSGVDSFSGSNTLDCFAGGNSWARQSQLQTSAIITDEREHEMAYLIRHFTESIGPWMDLFDEEKHFAQSVPLKALRDALLRNAIAAVAAKQLGRTKGQKPFVGKQCQKPATMEVLEDDTGIDWFYKAANYYDKAIAFSRAYLQSLSGDLKTRVPPTASSLANSDDLLVAVSIFSLYESLDNLEMGWLQHLSGLNSLLYAVAPMQREQSHMVPAITVGRQASFWNFARADYQASYINRQRPFLDIEDLPLWRSCGLQVQGDGSLYTNAAEIQDDAMNCRYIAQLVSHTLLWLVLRVVNYVAMDHLTAASSSRQSSWEQLTALLDFWYGNLPRTFQPCAQMRYPLASRSPRTADPSTLTEVFFSMDQCAAAIQLYHFARILLLLNKPQLSSSAAGGAAMSRLKAYREVSTEAIRHAREIVGVALGRPRPAVRVEMLLPLYVAGGCLEADEERKVVLDVLEAIEKDTGCSTDVKVRSLVSEWGWDRGPEGID